MYCTKRMFIGILILATLTMQLAFIHAIPQSEVGFAIAGYGQKGDLWQVFVVLSNLSSKELSIYLSPVVVDSRGKEFPLEPVSVAQPVIIGRKGVSLKVSNGYLKKITLPPREEQPLPSPFRFSFKLPSSYKPVLIRLFPGGPAAELSKLPSFPLLTTPKINIGNQQQDVLMSIGKVARGLERTGKTDKPEMIGLRKVLECVNPELGSKLTMKVLTDFTVSSNDLWLLASVSFENKSQKIVEISLDNVIAVPQVEFEKKVTYKPVGIAMEEQVRLGFPFVEKISIKAGKKINIIVMYRLKFWELWIDEFMIMLR